MSHDTIKNTPLCVDLDGTLVKTDTLIESFLALIKHNPFYAFLLPFWLLQGKAHLKWEIARRVTLDVTSLPYHPELLAFLSDEHQHGRHLILVTASDVKIARQIADHLGIFAEVMGSDGKTNLSGNNKLKAMEARFGDKGFDYAGNAEVDLKIWPHAREAILVNASRRLLSKARKITSVSHIFNDKKMLLKMVIKALRIHQWAKNILIFVALIVAHKVNNPLSLFHSVLAFITFGLCASGVYLLNDMLDLDADRKHPRKKHRPFASGDLPLLYGFMLLPLLFIGGVALSLVLSFEFFLIIALYFILTTAYSFYFKKLVLIDVILLAGLYTIRIIAGAVAINAPTSQWLLAFSMFIFLSLALVKRFSELYTIRRSKEETSRGRGYFASDLEQLASFGVASGYIAVLVLALYIDSKEVVASYTYPHGLWLICPIFLYWISRVWLLAHRGQMHEDPILFAIKDKQSYILGFLVIIIMLLSGAK